MLISYRFVKDTTFLAKYSSQALRLLEHYFFIWEQIEQRMHCTNIFCVLSCVPVSSWQILVLQFLCVFHTIDYSMLNY